MKTLISITTLLSITTMLHAQSGKRALGDFTMLEVHAASSVTITQSDSNAISTESDGGLPLAITNIDNGVLRIGSSGNVSCHVWVKNLKAIKAKDASSVHSDNTLNTSSLDIVESDASIVNLSLKAGAVSAITKDASTLKLSGTADSLTVVSSDASTVKAQDLEAGKVTIKGSDASRIKVWAKNKISAKADDGSVVSYKGEPSEKSISANDNGVIKTEDGETVVKGDSDDKTSSSTNDSTSSSHSGFKHRFDDAYVGFGWVSGPNHNNADVQYGRSREFSIGFGEGYKFFKWNGIGVDVYYKSTDFFIEQNAMKTFPDATIHNAEKIAFNDFGGLLFDRFFIGKYFIDAGIYGDWIFHNRIVTWDHYDIGGTTKTITRNALPLLSDFDHGVQARIGSKNGISFFFNYRMTDLLKQPDGSTNGAPQLPPYVFGIDIGGF